MKIERYEQLGKAETQQAHLLQRTNDLLEQIERLKAIDTTENPRLVIAVSQELRRMYLDNYAVQQFEEGMKS